MRVELLVVPECPNATPALALVESLLADLSLSATVETTVLTTDEEARSRNFGGSPTFLIDGKDPFARDGSVTGLACRVYRTEHGLAGLPDRRDLASALSHAAASTG